MTRLFAVAWIAFAAWASPAAAQSETFAAWRAGFIDRAVARGVDRTLVTNTLQGVEPNARAIELDRSQPEYVRPIWEYLDSAASAARVDTGRQRLIEESALLAELEARYGVARETILAIWALESNYGSFIGNSDVVQALATLAWEGRRRDLFEGELYAVFEILERGLATREELIGGWAGAMGMTQFMPSSYLAYAVDHDGDGRVNVWSDRGDALASAANYLETFGWRTGEAWGAEVRLPEGFDYAMADGREMTVGGWAALGVTRADHAGWSADEQFLSAELVLPAGAGGAAFLTFANFDVIKRYNNSTAYALAAGVLADQIARRNSGVVADWPRGQQPLSRSQAQEMQRLLTQLGYSTGGIDGIIGPNSRRALRRWQQDQGLAADAFGTVSVLTRLQAQAQGR